MLVNNLVVAMTTTGTEHTTTIQLSSEKNRSYQALRTFYCGLIITQVIKVVNQQIVGLPPWFPSQSQKQQSNHPTKVKPVMPMHASIMKSSLSHAMKMSRTSDVPDPQAKKGLNILFFTTRHAGKTVEVIDTTSCMLFLDYLAK